ncbi:MAG: hypothetical protein LBK60_01735 [Verrucomicrobiales bacterium]|nr:hypothetical protein [Verrucomicrobiales bacterium]
MLININKASLLGRIDIQKVESDERAGGGDEGAEVKGSAIKACGKTAVGFAAFAGTFDAVSGFIEIGIMRD